MRAAEVLTLPRRTLIALCGPAGAGKSTWIWEIVQRNHLAPSAVVSSDACRLLLCDALGSVRPDEWMTLQQETFRLFGSIIEMRMRLGRLVIADTVNLYLDSRITMLEHAREFGYQSVLVVFDLAAETCLEQNQLRDASRRVPEPVIHSQRMMLDELLPYLGGEGWDHMVVLNERSRAPAIELEPER